jgi:hypothetical protein
VVGEYDVSLSPEYLGKVREGIRRLDDVVNAKYLMPSGRLTKTPWVEEIAQSVKGMVGFADRVLKHEDPLRQELAAALDEALAPPQHYGPVSWLEFGYLNARIDVQ